MDLFDDLPEPVNNQTICEAVASETVVKKTAKRSLQDEGGVSSKRVFKGERYKLQGHCAERKGEREEMQDAHTLIDHFHPHNPLGLKLSLYGVFDGHGGKRASNYFSSKLHHVLANKFPSSMEDKEVKKCLVESIKCLDDAYLAEARRQRPSWKDGSTAVVVLCVDEVLYIANLGDSKAIVCREEEGGELVAVALTTDHHPTNYEERMRIEKAGGFVRDGRVMGVLEVSRSVGDGPFKKHGVTCVADVKRYSLSPRDKFLMIACDGLWKTFDNNTAVRFVSDILKDQQIQATDFKSAETVRLETACNRVANEAVRRLSADNVTVLLVSISCQESSEDRSHGNHRDRRNLSESSVDSKCQEVKERRSSSSSYSLQT